MMWGQDGVYLVWMSRAQQVRPKPVVSLLACSNEKKKRVAASSCLGTFGQEQEEAYL